MGAYTLDTAIALFALCWFYGIAWLITRGWRDVSKQYPFTGMYTGKRYYFRSGSFAGASFGCFLILGGNREGAYVSTILPRHLCPPLLIPWNDIIGIERRGLLSRKIELKLEKDYAKSEAYNYISRNMAQKFECLSEGQWTYRHATKRVLFGKDEE